MYNAKNQFLKIIFSIAKFRSNLKFKLKWRWLRFINGLITKWLVWGITIIIVIRYWLKLKLKSKQYFSINGLITNKF